MVLKNELQLAKSDKEACLSKVDKFKEVMKELKRELLAMT